jgi:hypothetical protein
MLALTLVEDIGVAFGTLVFILGLILVLRPLKVHVTVRHERDHSGDQKEE